MIREIQLGEGALVAEVLHARALLEWVATEAVGLGCSHVHLDSATQRHSAHRLYLGAGYDITAFHFVRSI